jgi:hypothetical protein
MLLGALACFSGSMRITQAIKQAEWLALFAGWLVD